MTQAERETAILSLTPLVQGIAKGKSRPIVNRTLLDDLISAGWLGAIDAVDKFDPSRQVQLKVYAAKRIKGSILDSLRKLDPVNRGARQEVKRGEAHAPIIYSLDFRHIGINDRRALDAQAAIDSRLVLDSIFRRAKIRPRNTQILWRFIEGEGQISIGRSYGISQHAISLICSGSIRKLRKAAHAPGPFKRVVIADEI